MKKSVSLILSAICLLTFVLFATASSEKTDAEQVHTQFQSEIYSTESYTVDSAYFGAETGIVPQPYVEQTTAASVSSDYQAAVDEAASYLEYQSFSRQGLIAQLEYEGYTPQAAEYGVDNCGADWNEQALKSAETYLKYSSFSYNGLINALEFDGFTESEVTYAVQRCNADWNEEAVEAAARYIEYLGYNTRAEIVDMLEFEGFTYEQAVYAAQQNGF